MMRLRLILIAMMSLGALRVSGGIISYLRFEEGSSWFAEDQTGLMNGALLGFPDLSVGGGDVGPDGWSTSVYGPVVPLTGAANSGSLRFAGSSSAFVNLSNANTVNLGTEFTVELFFNPDQLVGFSPLFGFTVGSGLGMLMVNDSFGVQFQDQQRYFVATGVQTGVWQHLALIKRPGEYSVYIDGNLLIHDTLPSSADGPYSFFGTDISGDRDMGAGFRGYLDEFRISDTALTPDQFLIVPEPGTMGLLGLGGLALLAMRRGRGIRKSSQS